MILTFDEILQHIDEACEEDITMLYELYENLACQIEKHRNNRLLDLQHRVDWLEQRMVNLRANSK